MIEAELKARVREPERVRAALEARAPGVVAIYRDTYYDQPGGELAAGERELRVRVVEDATGRRCMLTYKAAIVDVASGSKPEYEIRADDPDSLDAILTGLGFEHLIAFEKHCVNFAITAYGRVMTATLVRVPELPGQAFLEVESLVEAEQAVPPALADIRRLLAELGISETDLTIELYTEAVAASRERA
ncbi:MAG: CYTH domain-containing protein [Sporichthyaceae bacterium]|nr:CYTH domain-containing protein [Sporichthyaceae bacterium]